MRVLLQLGWYIRENLAIYVVGVLGLIVADMMTLVPPRVVGIVVDDMVGGTLTRRELLLWLALLLGTAAVGYGARYVWRILLNGAAFRLSRLLRNRLYEHFTRMSPRFYQERRVGDLMAHATNDVQAVEAAMNDGVLLMIDSIVMGGLTLGIMAFGISWQLTLAALVPLPLMAWTMGRLGRLIHERFEVAQAAFSDLNDRVHENLSGMRVVKAFGQQDAERRAFNELSQEVVDKNVRVARVDAMFEPSISGLVGLSVLIAIGVGALLVVRGALTIGELTSFAMYLGELVWPMIAFGFLFNVLQRGRASYDRIQALMAIRPDIGEAPGAREELPTGDVTYAIDRFRYPGDEHASLESIHVTIPRGATLGVVGKLGSGKSTILRLLLREFDLGDGEGEVRIGGVPIQEFRLAALRRAVAYVPQDHFLFSSTVAENIAFAKPDATRAEIEEAARLAAIDEDIRGFPDGYETVVGERGVTLSGGQKQRLSIARALLLDAEILILDDALSAVDSRTEARILAALRENRAGRTTLISAHRMSAVEHADEILVMESGRIAERGTHRELMERGGWYAAMYRRQQLEELVERGGESA